MRQLLRKDAPWLWAAGLVGLAIHLGMQIDRGGQWTRPEDRFSKDALGFYWIAATALGLIAALLDDVMRTREYLSHRSLSHARLFMTRQLGCGLVLLGWILLSPALHLAFSLLFRADGALVHPGRYFIFVDESTPALVFYALGVFAGTLARRPIWVLPLAAMLSSVSAMVWYTRYQKHWHWLSTGPVTPIAIAVAAVILWGALVNDRQGRELDLPLTRQRLWLSATIALVLLVPGASFGLGALQLAGRALLAKERPLVGTRADGQYRLYRPRANRRVAEYDSEHRKLHEVPAAGLTPIWNAVRDRPGETPNFASLEDGRRRFEGRAIRGLPCSHYELQCFATSEGFIELIREAEDAGDVLALGAPSRRLLGQGPGNQRFPREARPVGYWWEGDAFVADPTTGAIWIADLRRTEPAFAPLAVPEGDRYLADLTGLLWDRVSQTVFYSTSRPLPLVVAGHRGTYIFVEGRLQPAPAPVHQARQEYLALNALKAETTPEGPVRFTLTITGADGAPVFTHRFVPGRFGEIVYAAGVHATSLVRPPLFMLASVPMRDVTADERRPTNFSASRGDPSFHWLFDPFVADLPLPITIANALLALVLAALTWRRLTQFGVPGWRRWYWIVAVALGGVVAYFVARGLEPRRAWLPAPAAAPEPAPALLIQTA